MKLKKLFALFLAMTMTVSSVPQVYAGELLIEEAPVEESVQADDLLVEEEAPVFEEELTEVPADLAADEIVDEVPAEAIPADEVYGDGEIEIVDFSEYEEPAVVGEDTTNEYKITFHYYEGTDSIVKVAAVEGEKVYVAEPTDTDDRTGYKFEKWVKEEGNADADDFFDTEGRKGEPITSDLDLYAIWTAKKVNVSYSTGTPAYPGEVVWEDNPGTVEYDFGTAGTELVGFDDPKCDGNKFLGWFVNDTPIEDYSIDTEDSIVVTAKWEQLKGFKVTFEKGNIDDKEKPITLPANANNKKYGDTIAINDYAPINGYTFQGWSVNGDTKVENLVKGNSFQIAEPYTKEGTVTDLKLTGVWKLHEGNIQFYDAKREKLGNLVPFKYGDTVLPPSQPEKEGWTFDGWRKGSETGEKFDIENIKEDKDTLVNLYPGWLENTYTVTFKEAVKKDDKYEDATRTTGYKGKITDIPTAPTKEGQTFIKWVYTVDGEEKDFNSSVEITSDLTVTAKYEAAAANINFNEYKGMTFEDGTTVAPIAAKFGETVGTAAGSKHVIQKLKDYNNGGEHYHFVDWTYKVTENKKVVTKNLSEAPTTIPAEGLELTAKWQCYYNVTFINKQTGFASDAGEKGKVVEVKVDKPNTVITLKKADIEGYVDPASTEDQYFWGWKQDTENGADFKFVEDAEKPSKTTKISGDKTIVAKWTPFYTIKFDPDGGVLEGEDSVRIPGGKTYKDIFETDKLPVPTLEGKTFDHWEDTTAGSTIKNFTATTVVNNAAILKAIWKNEIQQVKDSKGNLYTTLAQADEQAAEGVTLTPLVDITLKNGVTFHKDFTLDLDGKTLKGDIAVASGKKLTIKNGNLTESQLSGTVEIAGGTYSKVTLAADAAVTIVPTSNSKFDESTKDQLEAANNEGKVFDPDKYMLAQTKSSNGYYVITEYKTLTYNLGDYAGAPSPKKVKVAKGEATKAPTQDPKTKEWSPIEIPERAYDENGEALADAFVPAGWYTDATFKTGTEFTFGKTLDKDTTIYLKWAGTHNVKFIFDNADVVDGKEVEKDEKEKVVIVDHDTAVKTTDIPADPTKKVEGVDKEFEFWGTKAADGTWKAWDPNSKITESITLTAKWKADVTFYSEGKLLDELTEHPAYGGKVKEPAAPTHSAGTNANFRSWYKADKEGNPTDEIFDFTKPVYGDAKVAAVWDLSGLWQFSNVYSDVASNGKINGQDEIDYVGKKGDPIVIKELKDWSPYEGSKDKLNGYYLGYQVEAPSEITAATVGQYSISYDGNGQNWVALETLVDSNVNVNKNIVVNLFEQIELANLKKWADDAVKANATTYPQLIKTYQIAKTSDTKTVLFTGKVYLDPKFVEVKNVNGENELTIINYKYKTHTVKFESNNDDITVKDQIVADNDPADDPAVIDKKNFDAQVAKAKENGFEFKYWTAVEPSKWKAENPDDANAKGPEKFDFAKTVITKDITLYGYGHKIHTVTLIDRDKTTVETFREGVHRATIEAQIGTPTGAHGWIDENDVEFKGNSTYDANWTLTADLTLYAQYDESKIVFNFLNNELAEKSDKQLFDVKLGEYLTDKIDAKTGNIIINKTTKIEVSKKAPKNMVFGYWTLDEPDTNAKKQLTNTYASAPTKFDPSKTLVQKDMTLYAYWTNKTVKVTFKYADGTETVVDANLGEELAEDKYPATKEYGAYWTAVAPAKDGTWADRPAKWGYKRSFEGNTTLYEYAPEEPVDVIFNFNDGGKTLDKKVIVNKGDVIQTTDIPKLEAVGAYWTKVAPTNGEWAEAPEKFDFTKIIEEATTLYAFAPKTTLTLDPEEIAIDPGKTAEVAAEMIESDEIAKAEIADADVATVEFTNDEAGKGTIKVTAGAHYGLTTVTVTTKGGATAELKVRVHFDDMTNPDGPLHYDSVYWAADNGITTGWDDNTFRPMNAVNRASVVTFLWRIAGKPEPTTMATFSDMTGNEEFDKAISWAQEQGITTGWDDNTFRPWNNCNRAAIITFIWRYAGKPQATRTASFDDMPDNADFVAAINWGVAEGIVEGWKEDNTFRPWDQCKRHAVVTFLHRFAE